MCRLCKLFTDQEDLLPDSILFVQDLPGNFRHRCPLRPSPSLEFDRPSSSLMSILVSLFIPVRAAIVRGYQDSFLWTEPTPTYSGYKDEFVGLM
jgi:hypothetical protein